jgi:PAS domain S-box-containing protein
MNSVAGSSREVFRSAIGVPLVAALMVISFTFGLRQSLAGEQSDLSGVLLIGGALAALSLAVATGVAHAAWRSSRRTLDLHNAAPCGFHFLDREGRILTVNDTELGWLLYAREELEGKKLADVVTAGSLRDFQAHRQRLEREGSAGRLEMEMVRKDGQRVPVLVDTVLVRDRRGEFMACRSTVFDITEQKRIESALRESEERLSRILAAIPQAILVHDRQGKITFASAAAETMLGLPRRVIEGRAHDDVKWKIAAAGGQPLSAEELPFSRALKSGGPVLDIELALEGLHGARFTLSASAAPLRDRAGAVVGVVTSAIDIGRRKEAERAKDEMVTTVSKELRTSLWNLRGFAELMLTRTFSPFKLQEFLKVIHQETVGLTNLINDFIDLQRMESRSKAYDLRPIRLPPLLGETLAFFQGGGTHLLRMDLSPDLPAVSADIDGIRQVVSNLISNAMKFSPDGGRIEIGARREGSEVVLWVKDQGIGIAPADVPRLFTKFFRVRTVKTQGVGGSGLGLALVKQIVTAMNGRVWVESEVGKGSTFFFSLPPALEAESGSAAAGSSGQLPAEAGRLPSRQPAGQFEAQGSGAK